MRSTLATLLHVLVALLAGATLLLTTALLSVPGLDLGLAWVFIALATVAVFVLVLLYARALRW